MPSSSRARDHEQSAHLGPAKHGWQFLGLVEHRLQENRTLAAECDVAEAPERVRRLGADSPRPLPHLEAVGNVLLDFENATAR